MLRQAGIGIVVEKEFPKWASTFRRSRFNSFFSLQGCFTRRKQSDIGGRRIMKNLILSVQHLLAMYTGAILVQSLLVQV